MSGICFTATNLHEQQLHWASGMAMYCARVMGSHIFSVVLGLPVKLCVKVDDRQVSRGRQEYNVVHRLQATRNKSRLEYHVPSDLGEQRRPCTCPNLAC